MPELIVSQMTDRIFLVRGHKVMLDEDLARIYGVTTKRLNQQVRRNISRFPSDFMFQLSADESLRLHFATLDNHGRGRYRKYLPYAFTEHGAVMASAVLKTPVAIEASIQIARAFTQLRQLLSSHKELAHQLENLERHYDAKFLEVFDAIRMLMRRTASPRKRGLVVKGFLKE